MKDGETESLPRRDMESFLECHGSDVSGDAGTSCREAGRRRSIASGDRGAVILGRRPEGRGAGGGLFWGRKRLPVPGAVRGSRVRPGSGSAAAAGVTRLKPGLVPGLFVQLAHRRGTPETQKTPSRTPPPPAQHPPRSPTSRPPRPRLICSEVTVQEGPFCSPPGSGRRPRCSLLSSAPLICSK